MADAGHNSGGVDSARLTSFVERIERLHAEREALASDISDVFSEAKGTGFDVKILREVIRLRRMDPDARDERETLIDLYMRALAA
jgi:uncharacterized protein (UPF0335 family)